MSDTRWITLMEVSTRSEAEMIKEALIAQGIPAEVFQGTTHALFPGLLGTAEVCVPPERFAEAKSWTEQLENTELELPDNEMGEDGEEGV